MSRGKSNPKRNRADFSIRGASLIKLNKSDEERKDRGSERWKYPPIRARIIPASQQRPVSVAFLDYEITLFGPIESPTRTISQYC